MKITTQMDGDMQSTYATSLLEQEQFPESFKFYFKRKQLKNKQDELSELRDLVRPRLRIAIVTETCSKRDVAYVLCISPSICVVIFML